MLRELRSMILMISSPLCGISCIVCFIRMMSSPDEKTFVICKETLKKIIIAWAALNGVTLIAAAAIDLVGGDPEISAML